MRDRELICPICNKEMTYINNFITHIRGAHIKKGELSQVINKINSSDGLNRNLKDIIINEFSNEEPIPDEFDEEIMECIARSKENDLVNSNKRLLNNYLEMTNPICREERQFANLLSNKLKTNKDMIYDILGYDVSSDSFEICDIYFEVTLMRDYWFINPEEFNQRLYNYVVKYIDTNGIKERNIEIGENTIINHANYWRKSHPIARWMMNAKPDIGILLYNKREDEIELNLIECKYLSIESQYYSKDHSIKRSQTEIQELLLGFICDEYGLFYIYKNKEYRVKRGSVKKVIFSSLASINNTSQKYIEFSKLID